MDDISAFFAGISVSDFERETSATGETAYSAEHKQTIVQGSENFDRFVNAMLVATTTAAGLNPFKFVPFTVVHSTEKQRYFRPDDDETVLDYRRRLHREAEAMNGTWLYTAMLAPGRAYLEDAEPDPIDANDPVALAEALQSGKLHLSICWYAEMQEGVDVRRRAGIIQLNDDGTPGENIEGDVDEEYNPFHDVLVA